jgi:hypothetical protein
MGTPEFFKNICATRGRLSFRIQKSIIGKITMKNMTPNLIPTPEDRPQKKRDGILTATWGHHSFHPIWSHCILS